MAAPRPPPFVAFSEPQARTLRRRHRLLPYPIAATSDVVVPAAVMLEQARVGEKRGALQLDGGLAARLVGDVDPEDLAATEAAYTVAAEASDDYWMPVKKKVKLARPLPPGGSLEAVATVRAEAAAAAARAEAARRAVRPASASAAVVEAAMAWLVRPALSAAGALAEAAGLVPDSRRGRVPADRLGDLQALRQAVFDDLHGRGYFVSGGSKYGADFLGYLTDPEFCHAQALFFVRVPDEALSTAIVSGQGRMATSVRKRAVIASHDEAGRLTYTEMGFLQRSGRFMFKNASL